MILTTALRLYAIHASTAILGDRIRPQVLQQGETLPAATYITVSSANQDSLDGPTNHHNDRVQIDVYADDSTQLSTLARALRDRLATAYGMLPISTAPAADEIEITGVQMASAIRDMPAESPVDGSDVWRFRVSFDMFFSYNA